MQCSRCEETQNLTLNSFYKDKKYYICRSCNTERSRKYRATPQGRAIVNAAAYRSTEKYFKKQISRKLLNAAVLSGEMIRPNTCSICKQVKRMIDGHHTDYDFPYKVQWVCRQCHFGLHKKQPRKNLLIDPIIED